MNNKNIRLSADGLLHVHWLFPDETFGPVSAALGASGWRSL